METLNALMIFLYRLFTFAFLFLTCSITNAQESMSVPKISGKIIFDGVPDEDVWQSLPSFSMVMHSPVYGNEPTESSEVKITYDDDYLYVSGILNYKDPATIRAVSKKRDYATPSSDWIGFMLDTFNDKQNSVGFFTNPNGLRTDVAIKNDATSAEEDINFTWNTFWDVKSVLKDNNWSVEFRIPLSSLRFQVKEGMTEMGITLWRYVAAKSEMITYPSILPEYQNAFWKPSLSSGIAFEGLQPKNPIYLTPYVTSGLSQVNDLNESGTAYEISSTPKFDAGIDAKYSITNNLTMDLTINTDFAQVEADDQKINLSRFSLYFPEKRVFFQEKADVFDFSLLGGNNLFYSRRIGIYDGNPVRIYGGMRLTGRVNKWDLGILDMQTAAFEDNPGENFGVLRAKRTVINANSYVGGMLTSRIGANGTYNMNYGIDGQFRVTSDDYFTLKLAQTFENDSVNIIFDLAPTRLLLQWERRNQKGFGYDFLYTYSGDRFNPGIGFEVKDNYQGFRTIIQYGWFPDMDAVIRYQKISFTGYNFWNTATGQQETTTGMLTWSFEAKRGFSGSIIASEYREDIADTLTLGNDQAFIPPGRYSFANLTAMYTTSKSNSLSVMLSAEAGSFYDGVKVSLSAAPKVIIGSGFELGLTYALDFVNFPDRETKFTNHIVGLKGLLTLSTNISLSSFIQYNTSVDKVVTNIRFRYNPREGNDFYVVYDEGLNTNILREVPRFPHSSGRTILLKYTYTFRF